MSCRISTLAVLLASFVVGTAFGEPAYSESKNVQAESLEPIIARVKEVVKVIVESSSDDGKDLAELFDELLNDDYDPNEKKNEKREERIKTLVVDVGKAYDICSSLYQSNGPIRADCEKINRTVNQLRSSVVVVADAIAKNYEKYVELGCINQTKAELDRLPAESSCAKLYQEAINLSEALLSTIEQAFTEFYSPQ